MMFLGKKFAVLSTAVLLSSSMISLLNASDNKKDGICNAMFREFNVSPEIKSSKGWQRVKAKDALYTYVDDKSKLTYDSKNTLLDCLISSSIDLNSLAHTIGDR